jgi:RES domain-containing protein
MEAGGTVLVPRPSTRLSPALEVLVHYSVLPRNHVLTEIRIPESLPILELAIRKLPAGWDSEVPISQTQDLGEKWIKEGRFPVLSVPSAVVAFERNFVINPGHDAFKEIEFLAPSPFHFDRRLKS